MRKMTLVSRRKREAQESLLREEKAANAEWRQVIPPALQQVPPAKRCICEDRHGQRYYRESPLCLSHKSHSIAVAYTVV